ncbi:MAG: Gldg family protein [Verrucomicrobia bacterium]|nr:Gldg family protein [Verrucomicrobiota bacterium]
MMKPFEKWIYSLAGVVALLIILLGINVLANLFKVRSDITSNHLYTLSPGTKRILSKIDTPVEIRFYYSRDNAAMPVPLRTYAQQVEDLLDEYQQAGRGKIKVTKLDPKPDSDAEDSANLDGIQGQNLGLGDKVYLGIAVSCLDAKTALPFLSPDRENLLEYDLSRAIAGVINPKKAIIGVMSALPVTGRQSSPMMMLQRQAAERPYVFVTELKENFDVRDVPLTAAKIDDDISVLVVDYPKGISPQTEFAIDQYLLRGGKLIALLDPLSFIDAQTSGQNPMMGGGPTSASLDTLLKAWGLKFSADQVVLDPLFATQVQRDTGVLADATILSVGADGLNKNDPLGAATNDLLVPFVGAFSGTPAEGLHEEVLVKTSPQAGLVSAMSAQMGGAEGARKEYKPGNQSLALAVRLTGRFKTAFPNGRPAASKTDEQSGAAAPSLSPPPPGETLKEAKADSVVILVGDSDFAYDGIAGRTQQLMNQTVFVPSNGNLNFIESAVEQLAGDANLIGIRSRASASRPFTVVNKMEAAAEQRYQSKIDELENNLSATREKLSDLQTGKQSDQKTVLSPEQQAEIKKFQENEAKINRELKQVRKDLRQEIDSLQDFIKWIDIAAMPAVVTLAGLSLALWERRKRAAR